MTARTPASYEATDGVRAVLPTTVPPAAVHYAAGGSGAALAGALSATRRIGVSARRAPRVVELGGGGHCFARVLALYVHGNASDDAVRRVRGAIADALRCARAEDGSVVFADQRVRDAGFDFAGACVTWVKDIKRACYTRLQTGADAGVLAQLGVETPLDLYSPRGEIHPCVAVQARRAALLDLLPSSDHKARATEIEFTDLELRIFELITGSHIVLLSAVLQNPDAQSAAERKYTLQFRDLHGSTVMPATRDVLYIAHVDNGSHAVAVVPHNLSFRWLRHALSSGTARELKPYASAPLAGEKRAERDAAAAAATDDFAQAMRPSAAPESDDNVGDAAQASPPRKKAARAPSGISGKKPTTVAGATASASASKRSSTSTASFGPDSLLVKVPTVVLDRTALGDAISTVNVASNVLFQKDASRENYVRYKCVSGGGGCAAALSYSLSSNGLNLNEKTSVLVHTCRADDAQEAAKDAASSKKWTRSKVTVKQLLRMADEHEIDVTHYKTAKAFFDAVVQKAELGDATMSRASIYNLYNLAQVQLFGTLEEQVSKLKALFGLLEDFYGDKVRTHINTRKDGDKEVLVGFYVVMPYAKRIMKWGTRTLAVDATFSGDNDHRVKGSCWTIVHKQLSGLQADLTNRSALEASLPVVLAFEIANESTDTTKYALEAIGDYGFFDPPGPDELPPALGRDEQALAKLMHWLVISDGAKGIPQALGQLEAELRALGGEYAVFAVQTARDVVHMARNAYDALPKDVVANGGREKIKTLLKTWAQTPSRDKLRDTLAKARTGEDKLAKALVKWLDENPNLTPEKWAVAHTTVARVLASVTSNGAEGFNGTHAATRRRPLLHALVDMFLWSMHHYQELCVAVLGAQAISDGHNAGEAAMATAEDRTRLAAHRRLFADELRPFFGFHGEQWLDAKEKMAAYSAQQTPGAAHQFKVRRNARDAATHTVDLRARTCGCGAHNLGMPCVHAHVALRKAGRANVDAELAMWGAFGTRLLEATMAFREQLDVPPSIDWRTLGTSAVEPPSQGPRSALMAARSDKKKRKPRVTDRSRVPSRGEKRRVTCGNCGEEGHYKRGCTKPAQPLERAKRTAPVPD